MSRKNRNSNNPAANETAQDQTAVIIAELTAPTEQLAEQQPQPEQEPAAPADAEVQKKQREVSEATKWRNPEMNQDRHVVTQYDVDGVRTVTAVEFAAKVAAERNKHGGPKTHNEDNLMVVMGQKTYRVRASAVAGAKNEYIGYWQLITDRLAQGPASQGELARLVGRLDFIRYCLRNGWLAWANARVA